MRSKSLRVLLVILLLSPAVLLASCPPKNGDDLPLVLVFPARASNPSPSNSAAGVPVTSDLSWSAAARTESYDVYFGTVESAVESATPGSPEFKGNQTNLSYDPPGILSYTVTYYWRIDTQNPVSTKEGDVWIFTTEDAPVIAPGKVAGCSPLDGAADVATEVILSWNAAVGAQSYDVYFGTVQTQVQNATTGSAEFIGNQTELSYDPGALSYGADYYWRIDSVNPVDTTQGDVWSFTTTSYCWTRAAGWKSADVAYAACADASGNVYMAGSFVGSVNFAEDWGGSDTKTCVAWEDVFITKIDVNGDYCWTHTMGGPDMDRAHAICVDGSGNIYVTGEFWSTVNFEADWGGTDTKTSAGDEDIFLTKIDASGNYCWTRRMGGSDWDQAKAICADAGGNIYVTGFFGWLGAPGYTVNFAQDWAGTDTKTSAGDEDIFITKIDAGGNYCWTRRMGDSECDAARAVCADGSSNVYVVGYFGWLSPPGYTVNFAEDWTGTDTKTSAGMDDIFVTKIDMAGNYCWTRRMGGSEYDTADAVCADGSDNIYVTGYFFQTVNFEADWGGTDEKTSAGSYDVFVTKIDSAGNYGWTRSMGGADYDVVAGVCVDPSDNVYMTGSFESGTVNFAQDWGGSDTKTCAGWDDIFITKIGVAGDYCWTRRMGGSSVNIPYAICADLSYNVYVAGCFWESINFAEDWGGIDEKTSAGVADIFITKISQ